jgi:hypothetical protein
VVDGPSGLTGQQIWSFVNSLLPQQAAWLLLSASGMGKMVLMQHTSRVVSKVLVPQQAKVRLELFETILNELVTATTQHRTRISANLFISKKVFVSQGLSLRFFFFFFFVLILIIILNNNNDLKGMVL